MTCDGVRQFVLANDWDAATRRDASHAVHHLEACAACRSAAEDYDTLRVLLSSSPSAQPLADHSKNLAACVCEYLPFHGRSEIATSLKVAGTILLIVGIFGMGRHSIKTAAPSKFSVAPPTPVQAPRSVKAEPFAAAGVQNEIGAFKQVFREFDSRASWMLASKDGSEIGTVTTPIPSDKKLVLLRIAVSRGAKVMFESDLVVVAGHAADLNFPMSADQSLHYRIGASAEEPTRLTFRAELRRNAGNEPVAALATTVQPQSGQSLAAGQMKTDAGDYDFNLGLADTAACMVGP